MYERSEKMSPGLLYQNGSWPHGDSAVETRARVVPGPHRILLVEDDPALATLYKLRLELEGHDVVVASDGEEAARQAASVRPDLLVVDLHLPKVRGLKVLEALRQDETITSLRIGILTDVEDDAIRKQATELGAVACLFKPRIGPSELSSLVLGWLNA